MTNISNGGIGIGPISASNGYDLYRDTIFGIPMHEWHRLSPSDQRYYAERECVRRMSDERTNYLRNTMDTMVAASPKCPEPTFLTNTKLLLTGVES